MSDTPIVDQTTPVSAPTVLDEVQPAIDALRPAQTPESLAVEACNTCATALEATTSVDQHIVIVRDNGRIDDIRATQPDLISSITILDVGSDYVTDDAPKVTYEGYTGVGSVWGRAAPTELDKVKSLIDMLTKPTL